MSWKGNKRTEAEPPEQGPSSAKDGQRMEARGGTDAVKPKKQHEKKE